MKHVLQALLALSFFSGYSQSRPDHVVIVIMENHAYGEIVGNTSMAPYINGLLSDPKTALFTNSYAIEHPSQPNYLDLFSGSNQGCTDDLDLTGTPRAAGNLGAALLKKGFSFTGYSEDMPSVGYTGTAFSNYARKHNPWVNWQGGTLASNQIPAASNQPFTSFPTTFSTLPTVSFVIPNQVNDMHNGSFPSNVAPGDAWLQTNLDPYIQWCKTHNSLFILTFDEDDYSASNKVLTFFIGSNVVGGSYNESVDHYRLLRTLEDMYGLPYLGASATSSKINDVWAIGLPVHLVDYKGTCVGNRVSLKWQTAEETNNDHFVIERSVNGQPFQPAGIVASKGSLQTYLFEDVPLRGNNAYRLSQVDKDGKTSILGVRSIQYEPTAPFSVRPEITGDRAILHIDSYGNLPVRLTLCDMGGRMIYQSALPLPVGARDVPVQLPVSGVYILSLESGAFQQRLKLLRTN
jgi:hypothetical protein